MFYEDQPRSEFFKLGFACKMLIAILRKDFHGQIHFCRLKKIGYLNAFVMLMCIMKSWVNMLRIPQA